MKKVITFVFAFLVAGSVAFAQDAATTSQSGNDNDITISQSGTKGANNANVDQSGDGNAADIMQKGDNNGPSPGGPSGFTNNVLLTQSGGSEATIHQTGRDYVNLEQSGGSVAQVNQDYGEKQIVRGVNNEEATQTGGSKLYVRQQGTLELGSSGTRRLGSELRIEQFGGVGGDGHLMDIKQRDGAFAQVLQISVASHHEATIRQDGDSDIYLEQNSSFGTSTANINQTGDGNLVTGLSGGTSYARQGGNGGHTLDVDQTSAYDGVGGNTLKVYQGGVSQSATVTQNGSFNVASLDQTGNGNSSTITQNN